MNIFALGDAIPQVYNEYLSMGSAWNSGTSIDFTLKIFHEVVSWGSLPAIPPKCPERPAAAAIGEGGSTLKYRPTSPAAATLGDFRAASKPQRRL